MASTKANGFSLLELMITLSITIIMCAVATITMQPMITQQHVVNAYNTTLTALRRAHDQAASDMRVYQVTFSPPVAGVNGGTITVTQDIPTAPVLFAATLPVDVTFHVEPGVPTSPTTAPTTPDGFGSAANTFDFDQPPGGTGGDNIIYFYPDGSAQDAGPNGGNIESGVVYFGIPGNLSSCRAITLWGYTGRIRGWRLYQKSGAWSWSQQ